MPHYISIILINNKSLTQIIVRIQRNMELLLKLVRLDMEVIENISNLYSLISSRSFLTLFKTIHRDLTKCSEWGLFQLFDGPGCLRRFHGNYWIFEDEVVFSFSTAWNYSLIPSPRCSDNVRRELEWPPDLIMRHGNFYFLLIEYIAHC